MATIKDVAKAAGVSITTVSHVLNNKNSIGQKTIERVKHFAQKLNYRPNPLAVGLLKNKTMNIGVIVPNILNPYFTSIFKAINDYAKTKKYGVILVEAENWNKDTIEHLVSANVDGFLSLSLLEEDVLKKLDKKIVFVDQMKNIKYSTVKLDNEKSVINIVNFLVSNGHKEIAFFSGGNNFVSNQRLSGFEKAMENHCLSDKNVFHGEFTIESGKINMNRLVVSKKHSKITAVVCANDLIALGVYEVCKNNGLNIPDDYSITGIDGIDLSKFVQPALTTIKQPLEDFAQKSFDLLIDKISNNVVSHITTLSGTLIVRESVKKI